MLCALPLENSARELDGALYLVLQLAARSLPCLIGERMVNRILQEYDNPAIYFDIDHEPAFNRKMLDRGGRVISIHPEGINMFDTPSILGQFTSIIDDVSDLCVWGQAQADLVAETVPPESRAKVKGTGYPSFDLATQKFEGYYTEQEIVAAHGRDYILINTNFSYGNNIVGLKKWLEIVSDSGSLDYFKQETHLKFVHDLAEYQIKLVDYYTKLALMLADAFPERHVVFRPHPSENTETYEKAFAGKGNIFVTNELSVRNWLATCGPVIHHDCTTGIEALLMGRPVINYRPIFEENVAAPIPALAGVKVREPEEVVELIRSNGVSGEVLAEQLKIIEPYFATVNQNACKTLAALAKSYAGAEQPVLPGKPRFKARFNNYKMYLSRTIKANFPDGVCPEKKKKAASALSKFPRLTRAEIERRVAKLREIEPDLPQVQVKELCLNAFVVTPA